MSLIMKYIEKSSSQALQYLLFDKFQTGPE